MARFDGMDEMLQRVRDNLERTEAPVELPRAEARSLPDVPAHEQQYALTLERIRALLRDAEGLRGLLSPTYIRRLTHEQHEGLVDLLGQVLGELWNCEVSLKRLAPYD